MKEQWLKALGKMTYSVFALTAAHKGQQNAMIASWVSQVSYEPPLIAIAVHPSRRCHQMIVKSSAFALHALKMTQKNLVTRFMGTDPAAKFEGLDWQPGQTGVPILQDCVAWFECEVIDSVRPGNHTLFFGELIDAKTVSVEMVLTTGDYRGQYIGKA
jgi:flavin reductase (DIM6/NTAB) family NADH-FMN oxidoreductase RutF